MMEKMNPVVTALRDDIRRRQQVVQHIASLEEQLDMEAVLMVQAQGTNEAEEGIGAFLEKRSPDYVKLRK